MTATQNTLSRETLYMSEGTTDKEYSIVVELAGTGRATVTCFNGRRGGNQTEQVKTPQPVTIEEATKLAAKIRAEKIRKGYVPAEVAGYTPSEAMAVAAELDSKPARRARDSKADMAPQLCNAITAEEAEFYLDSPAWIMQQKHDGVRAIIHVDTAVWTESRVGLPVAINAESVKALRAHFDDAILDAEIVNGVPVILDMLYYGRNDLRALTVSQRLDLLGSISNVHLFIVQTARTPKEKRAALKILRKGGAEGVVLKRASAKYTPGRPHSGGDWLKWKFSASATLRVIAVGSKGKESIDVAASDGRKLASCSTIGKKVPRVGDFVEVEYLYAYRNGGIVQAVYTGIREDKTEADSADSLQYKGEKR